jgi:hypothetical protein
VTPAEAEVLASRVAEVVLSADNTNRLLISAQVRAEDALGRAMALLVRLEALSAEGSSI